MKKLFLSLGLSIGVQSSLQAGDLLKGFNLTEIGEYKYLATSDFTEKTDAMKAIDRLFELGMRQITLNPRAVMKDPRSSVLEPVTKMGRARSVERDNYKNLIKYIKSKGMSVGIRPIFFVVDERGNTPFKEKLEDGSEKIWWHGNIQPADPDKWFESFRTYLDIYLDIAKSSGVDEFTVGAELYSMTVGLEDQWEKYPHGFPAKWLELIRYAKKKLPNSRIMYDINFTDASVTSEDITSFGGELERWRYRLVDLKDESNENWRNFRDLWKAMDAVGIDMYRSLASSREDLPSTQEELVAQLTETASNYATQIDQVLYSISEACEVEKDVYFKELGYRSVEGGFYQPFVYADIQEGVYNDLHQAAAYEAIFKAFFEPQWPWFKGGVFWDASVDPKLHGAQDKGFSPLGKEATEAVFRRY